MRGLSLSSAPPILVRKSEIATSAQVRSCRQQLSVRAVEGKVDPYIECGEKYWGTQMTLTLLVLHI